jgi:hypothetical protein
LAESHSCLSKGHRGSASEHYDGSVQSFVAAFAKAARVFDVPEEAIMSDARAQLTSMVIAGIVAAQRGRA